ncbi:NIF3 NGG1 interactin-like proteing factor 3-like 1 [Delitschia confertaspora ATCC 74209]|uniref:NIF3 NGG1 interactin-like proteing factor 3-like 1 n=1 Tax=Delitschia confertaspora ATCC 74209 TaxID=1513339 RepID=A0A9P4JM50_9PLEO|nr:NIF3 NGG1 interactin-like proteing factor 3-like 1 [Delitschia confertaspora ATCC 74209]
MSATTTSAPFSRAVVRAMQRLYPKVLADNSWDNTGLLLEAPFKPTARLSNTVLLTIDLTRAVADEAIALNSSIIIAYHPIIFRGLKSLTLANTQQQTLLRLASHGISVYSPHTAVDAAPGGLGDWLADIVTGSVTSPQEEEITSALPTPTPATNPEDPFLDAPKRPTLHHQRSSYRLQKPALSTSPLKHTRRSIKPQSPELETHKGAGMGRVVTFSSPQPLSKLLDLIGRGLNNPKGFAVAIPQTKTISELNISSVGICAGSGASLLADQDVDLWFTGEVSHHEALAAIEQGKAVVSLFHSNSERGFLEDVLRWQLEEVVGEEWGKMREEQRGEEGVEEALEDEEVRIEVSKVDRDPYGIVVLKEE